jgi:hypothetical protein
VSVIADLLTGGASGLMAGMGTFAKELREAITGKSIIDPNKQAEILMNAAAIEAATVKMAADFDKSQMEGQAAIAKLEAASQDKFVTRWRPAIGWTCGLGLFYTFLAKPLLPFIFQCGAIITGRDVASVPILPEVPMGDLIVLLAGMLGLGTMRSVERIKGVGR